MLPHLVGAMLIWIKMSRPLPVQIATMTCIHLQPDRWLPVSIAPADTNLEVGVMDKHGDVVVLVFPVRKKGTFWVDAVSKKPSDIGPTHWRAWDDDR